MINHGFGDLQTVSARALDAGIDMDMVSEGFTRTLKQSLDEGIVTQAQIDQACRRILEAKYKLGLFDDPYLYCNEELASKELFSEENRQVSREIADECQELLEEALDIAKDADVIIAALGENANMNGEGASRSIPDIPEPQKELLKALVATDKPVVLVVFTGRPLILSWEDENVPAILNA